MIQVRNLYLLHLGKELTRAKNNIIHLLSLGCGASERRQPNHLRRTAVPARPHGGHGPAAAAANARPATANGCRADGLPAAHAAAAANGATALPAPRIRPSPHVSFLKRRAFL